MSAHRPFHTDGPRARDPEISAGEPFDSPLILSQPACRLRSPAPSALIAFVAAGRHRRFSLDARVATMHAVFPLKERDAFRRARLLAAIARLKASPSKVGH